VVQYIKQGNIFGRIGTGIGKGLSEQLPKEVERGRLASGLEKLGNQKGLTPFQQFAGLASQPGITPQMIESGTNLLRQEARGRALSEGQGAPITKFPEQPRQNTGIANGGSNVPSITKGPLLEKIQEGYKPRSEDEKFNAAGQKFNANPAFYGNDPQKAIEYENQVDSTEEKRFLADETQYNRLSDIQKNVVNRLGDQSNRLNTKVPAELYSKIEDEAIRATKPRSEGGRGISEQQAMKEYGDKLNNASRQFEKINQLDSWGIALRPSSETLRSIRQLQDEMEKLGETDNAAQEFIKSGQVSPQLAYSVFEPVRRVPQMSNYIKKLPELQKISGVVPPNISVRETMKVSPELAEFVKNNDKASPLAISYELQKKGYDPSLFLQYINDNARELNLRSRQSEQASTPLNTVPPWNDWWLSSFSGLE